ncbi:MAG: hypothetical protein ACNA8O_07790 [Cyanobacteriota bacterium]
MSVTDRILSALTTVIRMHDKVEAMAGLMKEQQRRLDDLQGRAGALVVDGERGAAAGHRHPPVPADGEALCGCDLTAKCM